MENVKFRDLTFLNFPGYAVDSDGGVWSQRKQGPVSGLTGKWRKITGRIGPVPGKENRIQFRRSGQRYNVQVLLSRLVLLAFVGPPPDDHMPGYKDGNTANCSLENVYWKPAKKAKPPKSRKLPRKDLTNQRFGKLIAKDFLDERHRTTSGHALIVWHCVCDCGGTRNALGQSLVDGSIYECKECLAERIKKRSERVLERREMVISRAERRRVRRLEIGAYSSKRPVGRPRQDKWDGYVLDSATG